VVAIIGKIGEFRGESLSLPGCTSSPSSRYPARSGGTSGATRPAAGHRGLGAAAGSTRPVPAREYEWRDLLRALRDAVERELTDRQRQVFVAIALRQVPLDDLVAEQNSSRNAIYKTPFDARRKLRASPDC
jgi:DNA-directed RNA polymerase specialized sigma24 family protein